MAVAVALVVRSQPPLPEVPRPPVAPQETEAAPVRTSVVVTSDATAPVSTTPAVPALEFEPWPAVPHPAAASVAAGLPVASRKSSAAALRNCGSAKIEFVSSPVFF